MSSKVLLTPTNQTLPSFFSLFRNSLSLIRQNFNSILGYTGWLILPIIAHIVIRTTLGLTDLSATLDLIANLTLIFVGINICNTIALHVPIWQTSHPNDSLRLAASTTASTIAQKNITSVAWAMIISGLMSIIGFIAIVIPGFILATWFSFAPLTVLFENTRGIAALQRSRNLVRGRFWSIAYRLWSFNFIVIFVYLIIAAIILFAFGFQPTASFGEWTPPLAADTLMSLLEIAVLPLAVIYLTLLYQALKVE